MRCRCCLCCFVGDFFGIGFCWLSVLFHQRVTVYLVFSVSRSAQDEVEDMQMRLFWQEVRGPVRSQASWKLGFLDREKFVAQKLVPLGGGLAIGSRFGETRFSGLQAGPLAATGAETLCSGKLRWESVMFHLDERL